MYETTIKSKIQSKKLTISKSEIAFTLIELLVVISVIGLISSIILVNTEKVREKARISRAIEDLHSLRNAIAIMSNDTGKWPNGCLINVSLLPEQGASNEVQLNQPAAGLLVRPNVGVTDTTSNCEWSASEVSYWSGPYANPNQLIDPWGTPYWFDNDSEAWRDCPLYTGPTKTETVIQSLGPNRTGGALTTNYDCDDISIFLAF